MTATVDRAARGAAVPPEAASTVADLPTLRRCVAEPVDAFAARYFGRRPLHSPALRFAQSGSAPGFTDLFSVDAADELLSRRGLRTPFLRVAKDGTVLPASRYTGGGGAGAEVSDQVLDERVLALFDAGATLVFQGLHRLWPPLVELAGRLARELAAPVQVNAYLTPPGNQGFATHYDTHDVFVLQVEGRKRWRVHEPVLVDPLERQPWGGRADEVAATADGPPALDVELSPGDTLYLPRGWLHAATALGERSLHLTLGIRALTRYALVEALLADAAAEPGLRAGFPLGLDPTDEAQLAGPLAEVTRLLRELLNRPDPDATAARLRASAWSATRPSPIRPLAQAAAVAAVDAGTRIAPRPGLRARVVPAGDRVRLELVDRSVELPAFCRPALEAVLRGPAAQAGDLPGLAAEDGVVLVRRLLREAVAVPLR
jgi:hypothetical protein